MALLNPPNMLTEAMRFLIRAVVASKGKLGSPDLIALVGVPGLAEAMSQIHTGDIDGDDHPGGSMKDGGRKNIAKESLLALLRLGILEENGGSIELGEYSDPAWRKVSDVTTRSFIERFEFAILTERGQAVGTDLLKSAAVIYTARNPLSAFDGFDESAATRRFAEHQEKELGTANQEEWGVGNRERWVSFRRMGSSLGWMSPLYVNGRSGLIPNAAPSLQRWLPVIEPGLHDGGEFLRGAATRLPFLDDGSLSLRKISAGDVLSGGLSLTLLNLQHRKLIELVDQADASKYGISVGGEHLEFFSHVKVLPSARKNRMR